MERCDRDYVVGEMERAIAESEDLLQQLRESERYIREMIAALKKELTDIRRSDSKKDGRSNF